MSKFHSAVSRRDFMKALGLVGVGLGGASLVAPVFHDLDELMSNEASDWKRPWWVKSVDKATVEIDWSMIERYDQRLSCQANHTNASYYGVDEWLAGSTLPKNYKIGDEGFELIDHAVNNAHRAFEDPKRMFEYEKHASFMGMDYATPEKLGVPKWTGTPEEASKMVRMMGLLLGAGAIGITPLEEKLVYTYGKGEGMLNGGANNAKWINAWPPPLDAGPKIDFIESDIGVDTYNTKLLPKRPLWDLAVMIPMPKEGWSVAVDGPGGKMSGIVSTGSNETRYRIFNLSIQPGMQAFFSTLGYHCYGYWDKAGGFCPAEASAVLAGVSEMSRHSDAIISPEYGPLGGYYSLATDMPLAEDLPVDAGIFKFCHTCGICAEACPSQSISHEKEPSWEIPQFNYRSPNVSNAPGKKCFWTDMGSCSKYRQTNLCRLCRPACAFNVGDKAMIHEIIKMTASTTSLFNGFFATLGRNFDYGWITSEEFWKEPTHGAWGWDSTKANTF